MLSSGDDIGKAGDFNVLDEAILQKLIVFWCYASG